MDSGVLLMRRMELYRGDGVAVDPIFQKNYNDQKKVVADLRKKYVAKMLLSDLNLCKDKFVESMEDYDKFSNYKKKIYSEKQLELVKSRVAKIGK